MSPDLALLTAIAIATIGGGIMPIREARTPPTKSPNSNALCIRGAIRIRRR